MLVDGGLPLQPVYGHRSVLKVWASLLDFSTDLDLSPAAEARSSALAHTLLTQTTLTVAEIARQCGYEAPNYFSRLFSQKDGDVGPYLSQQQSLRARNIGDSKPGPKLFLAVRRRL
ncbi:MAG: hypothetical protein ACI906_003265 [Candidatus Latescibacterota bacterium]